MHKPQANIPMPETDRGGASSKKKYPMDTMKIGEMFFVPRKRRTSMATHTSTRGKQLGRKFATREIHMREGDDGQWEPCEPDDEGAVRGVGVWRVE